MLVFILAVIVSGVVALLGLLAFNRRKYDNRAAHFSYLVVALGVWLICNQIGNGANFSLETRQLFTYADFSFGVALSVLFYFFAASFRSKTASHRSKTFALLSLLVVEALLFMGQVVVVTTSNGSLLVEEGNFYWLYLLVNLAYIFAAVRVLLIAYKSSVGSQRSQVKTIMQGLGVAALLLFVSNFFINRFVSDDSAALVAANLVTYVGVLVFVFASSLAIIRQKLFDIRETAARAAAYTISLLVIAVLYGGVIYVIGEKLFSSSEVSRTVERFIFIMFAVVTAALFAPLKRFFDRITNLVFYRDAYDPQQFLNELNKLLATTSDLESLLLPSAKVIQNYLKVDFVMFGLREHEKVPRRIVGTTKKVFHEEDIKQLRQLTVTAQEQVIVSEKLREKKQEIPGGSAILKILDKYNIAILARLADKRDTTEEGEGYLVLGPKKSGNAFSRQDTEIIEIVVNELVLAVQNALRFEEIEQFNETLQEKIYTATKELKRSNEKLKALDEAKDEFISMASHQLRTPLTSVKGYLSMLAEGDAGKLNETQKKFVDQSFVSAQRMVYLISDLLNVSRLKTGKFVIERVPTYLPTVIEDEISQLYETAASKGITLTYKKPEQFPTLLLDETKVRQVVMNFCDNAIYYSPGGGKVTLELSDKGKQVEFTVTDTGMGVPKSVQHHLFTKFYRADNARKVRPDGTGLGLFMAKKVIVAQGGSIVFKSAEGKGSTFGFSFPKEHHEIIAPETPEA